MELRRCFASVLPIALWMREKDAVTDSVLKKRSIGVDAHGFEISIDSLISVFQFGADIQIEVDSTLSSTFVKYLQTACYLPLQAI
ncbi:MAG: hypothetical protein PHU34_02130 [Candidatus Methanoperedens sp.]|nr:hypothetical protein [Candidatus Methanoperedens sp.]